MEKKRVNLDMKQYGMFIALIVIYLIFALLTGGKNLTPMNINNLVMQNGYVVILAIGMLLCVLTGNVDLGVTGGFWFSLSAEMVVGDNFDLKFKSPIVVGAEVAIAGDNLSFDLGFNAGADDTLLSNLISVGSEKNKAFIYGKACFEGKMGNFEGEKEICLYGSEAELFKPSFSIPMIIFGKLPVSACKMSLGDVLIGKCFNGNVVFSDDCDSFEKAKDAVDKAMSAYLSATGDQRDSLGYTLYDLKNLENSKF